MFPIFMPKNRHVKLVKYMKRDSQIVSESSSFLAPEEEVASFALGGCGRVVGS